MNGDQPHPQNQTTSEIVVNHIPPLHPERGDMGKLSVNNRIDLGG
jgi:hypothetical protein